MNRYVDDIKFWVINYFWGIYLWLKQFDLYNICVTENTWYIITMLISSDILDWSGIRVPILLLVFTVVWGMVGRLGLAQDRFRRSLSSQFSRIYCQNTKISLINSQLVSISRCVSLKKSSSGVITLIHMQSV